MRLLFYIYSFFYLAISLLIKYSQVNMFISHLMVFLSILSITIPALGCFIAILAPKFIPSNRHDQKYFNLCAVATGLRIIFLSCGIWGLRDQVFLLFLNASGLLIFSIFVQPKIKYVPKEYFKY